MQENEDKDLLCLKMRETHLICTLKRLHWHCGQAGHHLCSAACLPGEGMPEPRCLLLPVSPTQGQEGLVHSHETFFLRLFGKVI